MKKKSVPTPTQPEINDAMSSAEFLEPVNEPKVELMYEVKWSQERETEKAIMFDQDPTNITSKPFWIPKSLITYVDGKTLIPMWLAKRATK